MPKFCAAKAGLLANPQQVLPRSEVTLKAQALRDLVARENRPLDCLVRSLAGAPVLSAGLVEVCRKLGWLAGFQ